MSASFCINSEWRGALIASSGNLKCATITIHSFSDFNGLLDIQKLPIRMGSDPFTIIQNFSAGYRCLWAKKEKEKKKKKEKGKRRKGGPQPHNINTAYNNTTKQPAEHLAELRSVSCDCLRAVEKLDTGYSLRFARSSGFFSSF